MNLFFLNVIDIDDAEMLYTLITVIGYYRLESRQQRAPCDAADGGQPHHPRHLHPAVRPAVLQAVLPPRVRPQLAHLLL